MAGTPDIAAYRTEYQTHPHLWKAQQFFLGAETLRKRRYFDCAASRYYYATVQVAEHFVGRGPPSGGYWKHAELMGHYANNFDRQAYIAMGDAYKQRSDADYAPARVSQVKLGLIVDPVACMIHRAFQEAGVARDN